MSTMKPIAIVAFFALLCANDHARAAAGWNVYRNAHDGYAISYPPGWRIDTGHVYSALGPGKEIRGVAFMVPKNFTAGTNLSDSSWYLAVEILRSATARSAQPRSLDDAIDKPRMVTRLCTRASHGRCRMAADAGRRETFMKRPCRLSSARGPASPPAPSRIRPISAITIPAR